MNSPYVWVLAASAAAIVLMIVRGLYCRYWSGYGWSPQWTGLHAPPEWIQELLVAANPKTSCGMARAGKRMALLINTLSATRAGAYTCRPADRKRSDETFVMYWKRLTRGDGCLCDRWHENCHLFARAGII